MLERESPKKTISASDGLGLLQMVSEPDTELPRGWIVRSYIDWRGNETFLQECGNSFLADAF